MPIYGLTSDAGSASTAGAASIVPRSRDPQWYRASIRESGIPVSSGILKVRSRTRSRCRSGNESLRPLTTRTGCFAVSSNYGYEEQLLDRGGICSIAILEQDGPIAKEVYEVTLALLKIAEKCWSRSSMNWLGNRFPAGTRAGNRLGATVGSALHERFYQLALREKTAGRLPSNLKITPPTTMPGFPARLRKGPDFVLNGHYGGQDLVAAWEFTTSNALASHYDRDVLGRSRRERPRPDIGIQQEPDTTLYWSSYIAICY